MTKQRYKVGDYVVVLNPDNPLDGQVCKVLKVIDQSPDDLYLLERGILRVALRGRWLSRPLVMDDSATAIVEQMQSEWGMSKQDDICPDSPLQPPNLYPNLYRDVARYINMGYEVPLPFDDLGESEQDDE